MDQVMAFVDPFKQLSKDSIRLIKRCTKPDRKEFQKIAMATAIGFAIMGFIGFFVKLIHIPINNIIVIACECMCLLGPLPPPAALLLVAVHCLLVHPLLEAVQEGLGAEERRGRGRASPPCDCAHGCRV